MTTNPMQDPVAMAELESLHCHEHPALDVGALKQQRLVLDDSLKISVEELEHQVEVGLVAEDVYQLRTRGEGRVSEGAPGVGVAVATDLDHVGVAQLAQKLDLPDRRHVQAILELPNFDLGVVSR